jgi:hypothetical protein
VVVGELAVVRRRGRWGDEGGLHHRHRRRDRGLLLRPYCEPLGAPRDGDRQRHRCRLCLPLG